MGDYSPTPDPYGLVAPDGGDPINNGDNRFRALVDQLSDVLPLYAPLTVVSALPGSPVDGQIAYYQDATLAAAGVVWQFRYRSAATTYKWEFVGGPPIHKVVETSESTSSGTYAALATAGPSYTAPLTGYYVAGYGSSISADGGIHSLDVSGFSASDAWGAYVLDVGSSGMAAAVGRERLFLMNSGDSFTSKYRVSAGVAASFSQRWLNVLPVRVSG